MTDTKKHDHRKNRTPRTLARATATAATIRYLLCAVASLFFVSPAFSSDMGAELVEIIGPVSVTFKSTGKTVTAAEGTKVGPGDSIETGPGGEVEILYDDGNVTALDEKTKVTIERIAVEPGSGSESTIDLIIGRVKSIITKISDVKMKFAVRTKSAVAGVTGTPPFVVTFLPSGGPGGSPSTEVDLLGAPGQRGGISVRGTDRNASVVNLTPGTRTVSTLGLPPLKPFRIEPQRMRSLERAMPIRTPEEKREEKRKKVKEIVQSASESKQEEEQPTEETAEETSAEEEQPAEETTEEETPTEEEPVAETSDEETPTEEAADETVAGETAVEENVTQETDAAVSADDAAEKETPTAETQTEETAPAPSVATTAGEAPSTAPAQAATAETPASTPSPVAGASPSAGTLATPGSTPGGPAAATLKRPGNMTLNTGDMINHMSRSVSVGLIETPQESSTGETTESQIKQGISAVTGTGESPVTPTTRVEITVNINRQ